MKETDPQDPDLSSSYASVSSATRSAGALSHHGDHLQGRQDNASLSPSRPFWPSQLLWPPRHSPLFGGRLETSISRNLPTVRAQGPEVCRARPPSPSIPEGLCLYPGVSRFSPTCSQARPFQGLRGATWATRATLPVGHQSPYAPATSRDSPGMVGRELPEGGGGRGTHTSCPPQGPFPTWPACFFVCSQSSSPLGGVRTRPWNCSPHPVPATCQSDPGGAGTQVDTHVSHPGRSLQGAWSDRPDMPFLQCHLNSRAALHLQHLSVIPDHWEHACRIAQNICTSVLREGW